MGPKEGLDLLVRGSTVDDFRLAQNRKSVSVLFGQAAIVAQPQADRIDYAAQKTAKALQCQVHLGMAEERVDDRHLREP